MRVRATVGEEERAYAFEWSPTTVDMRKGAIAKAPQWHELMISATQSRVDYDLWCLNHDMDLGIDHWYFDEMADEGQVNPVTNLGYLDEDGKWMPTMRLFQYRQIWKRLYALMQERGRKEPVITIHDTSTAFAGPMAFCTTTWDFEQANMDPNHRQLTKFGMDYLITETMGHQYGFAASTLGPVSHFEGWIRPDQKEETAAAARHWMGVHMVLEMNPYLNIQPQLIEGLRTLGEFGWNEKDCRWIPYWQALRDKLYSYTPSADARIYVTLYRRPGQALIIFLNDTSADATVLWKPEAKLGVSGALTDVEKKDERIAADGGAYSVSVPRFDYRALRVDLAE
jgi:hypothetical protein